MLFQIVQMNHKLLKYVNSRHFFKKNFQMTKFCERAHNDITFRNKP